MSSDGNINRPFLSLLLLGIVDFCCILIGLEQISVEKILSGIIWISVGVGSGSIGYYWPQIKLRFASNRRYRVGFYSVTALAVCAGIGLQVYRHYHPYFPVHTPPPQANQEPPPVTQPENPKPLQEPRPQRVRPLGPSSGKREASKEPISKEPIQGISPDEQERRDHLLSKLQQEYWVTHRGDIPSGVHDLSTLPLPTDWANRRLYELGEPWAIGIPDSIVALSNAKLITEGERIRSQINELQGKYGPQYEAVSDKWRNADIAAQMHGTPEDFAKLHDRRDAELKERMQIDTAMDNEFQKMRPNMRNLRNEMLRRLGIKAASDGDDGMANMVIDKGMLGGANPLSYVWRYFGELESQFKE